jgi:hypothetical protein
MLRISLFGPPNRRKQPKRYVQFCLNFVKLIDKYIKPIKINVMKMEKKQFLLVIIFSIKLFIYPQENNNLGIENESEYIDFGIDEGIIIYGEPPDPDEDYILLNLNGFQTERENFIENKFLAEAGFRRSGNIKYRKTKGSEKALSVLHGITHAFSFGIVPMKPYFEIEYGELPKGEYYAFESIIYTSKYKYYSPAILTAIELEYKLQIEFCNGILHQNNINYYTEENIKRFEELVLILPDSIEGYSQLKGRYLNIELPKIKAALERYKNPSENYLRALENLKDMFN